MEPPDDYTPEEADRRAKETAHRLLNTPPKPQSQIKGIPKAKNPKRPPQDDPLSD